MDLNNLELEFENAEEITPQDLDDFLSLDFGVDSTAKEQEKKKPLKQVETKEKREEEEKEKTQELEIPLEDEDEEEIEKVDYTSLINRLTDLGIITEPYEGFNPDADGDEEMLINLLNHNIQNRDDKVVESFFDTLSDTTKRIVLFDVNSKGEDVETYLKSLLEENSIKNLSVENEYDQEKIIRQWYRNKENFSSDEVNEKITELKDAGLLEKEAKRLKPKLDEEAENIAKRMEAEKEEVRKMEAAAKESYNKKLVQYLGQGKVGNVNLTKEELGSLYTFLSNDEHEVTVPGGKKVLMNPLEALIMFNKYNNKGSLENLAIATLYLINPSKVEEYFLKKAETKVTEEFATNYKYKMVGNSQPSPKVKEKKPDSKQSKWRLVID